jgi:competence protein ComEC
MSKSKILFYFCLSFIFGIFLSSIIAFSQPLMLGFLTPHLLIGAGLILGIILISVLRRYPKVAVMGFCLIFLILGIWRHQTVELRIKNNELRKYNDLGEVITLVGKVVSEPDVREKSTKLTTEINPITWVETGSRPILGKVLITVGRYPEYKYGDELKIIGELKTPPVFEDFNYKDYLAKSGIYSVVCWPEIEILAKDQGNFIYRKILGFKNKLRESIYQNLSPPQTSILGAMILGDKSRMSDDLKEKLNIAGVRHITAVSGMHIVILSGVLMSLLLGLGFWRGQAFYFSIIIISLFIIMIGAHPSAIRAGIMGGLFLLGQKVGRKSFSPRAIIMAAALMLVINPLLLLDDVGFQLSFLAAMGIIYLSPIFKRWFKFVPGEIRNILAMTFAAQIFTLPILVYNFGRISLVAPLTNILILTFVPLIMISGFIFALVGMLWQPLGWIFSLPCWLLLTYLLKIVDFFSQPWAAKTIENIHWFWLIISYLILGFLVFWLNKREKLKFLDY